MKMVAKDSLIEIEDDDDDFLSQVAAAEAHALANKRRKVTPPSNDGVPISRASHGKHDLGGAYTEALKGNHSFAFRSAASGRIRGGAAKETPNEVAPGNDAVYGGGRSDGGDSCFKCGKSGHWARDCDATGGGGGGGGTYGNYGADPSIPEKNCPCGNGGCLILTANTEKNRGRKFYRCPLRQENGGCGFFEWVDAASGTNAMAGGTQNYASNSMFPDLPCPCGAGFCLILTAKTGKNVGQQFYRCPLNQGSSCNFFKWCNEHTTLAGPPVTVSKVHYNASDANNKSSNARIGSCFKCGKEGHWAKDCSTPSTFSPTGMGVRSALSNTCSKCGKPGHWARDCSFH